MTDKAAKKKSPLIGQYYKLVIWIQDRLVRFPKVERNALVPQIGNLVTELLRLYGCADYKRESMQIRFLCWLQVQPNE
ncbi:hypothetical protein GF406_01125 [candidate division KSB1 bacterium]|nr:hypothetical protein [candidate division KSB1 bacterium]